MSTPLLHPLVGSQVVPLTRTLIRHGGVSARSLPRIAIAYFSAVVRVVACGIEALRARPAHQARFTAAPVFIVGHWRSGTTLLHHLLTRDDAFCFPRALDVLSPYEFLPTPIGKYTHPLIYRQFPPMRAMDDVPIEAGLPQEEEAAMAAMGVASFMNCLYFPKQMARIFEQEVLLDRKNDSARDGEDLAHWRKAFRYYLAKVALRYDGRRLLLKNPANSARILQLRAMFPDAKFIHIHRNPYEVFPSMMKLYERLLPIAALQPFDLAVLPQQVLTGYRALMDDLIAARAKIPKQDWIDVAYADVLSAPFETVEKIYSAIGAPFSDDTREQLTAFLERLPIVPPKPAQLDDGLAARIYDAWRPIFSALGYDKVQRTSIAG